MQNSDTANALHNSTLYEVEGATPRGLFQLRAAPVATQALIAVAIKLKGTARAAVRSHVAEHSTLSHATRASGDDWAARDGGSGGGSSCTRRSLSSRGRWGRISSLVEAEMYIYGVKQHLLFS